MKKIACLLGILILTLVYGFAMAASNTPPSAPVTVVNGDVNPVPVSAPKPLPISGTINISGTSDVNVTNNPLNVNVTNTIPWDVSVTNTSIPVSGTIDAKQSGPWTVGLSDNTVLIGNPVTKPVFVQDVNTTVKQPFATDTLPYTVPQNKNLVIELVTFYALATNGPSFIAPYIEVTTNGQTVSHYLELNVQDYTVSGIIQKVYLCSRAMRIYADPESQVKINNSHAGNFINLRYSIYGYLEDIP